MSIDSNHVTKLGELKYLIDQLWGKIKSTFSAIGHTHTKSDVTDFPTNVSAFANDSGYLTEATVPQYELTADKIAAVGELSNSTSGTAQFAKTASTAANGGVFSNAVPSGNASFKAESTGYQSKSHSISLFSKDGTSGTCGGLNFDSTDILEVDADGNVQLNGNADTATTSTKSKYILDCDATDGSEIEVTYKGTSVDTFNRIAGFVSSTDGKETKIKDVSQGGLRKYVNGSSVGATYIPTYIDSAGAVTAGISMEPALYSSSKAMTYDCMYHFFTQTSTSAVIITVTPASLKLKVVYTFNRRYNSSNCQIKFNANSSYTLRYGNTDKSLSSAFTFTTVTQGMKICRVSDSIIYVMYY